MIRIRTGTPISSSSSEDPARALLGIEVDGIEISGGRLEDRPLPAVSALAEALHALASGEARVVSLPFSRGTHELILVRRGRSVFLTILSLLRPARLVVQDLEVELSALIEATEESARELLASSQDGTDARLRRALARLAPVVTEMLGDEGDAPIREVETLRKEERSSDRPALSFELWDADGRLSEESTGIYPLLLAGRIVLSVGSGLRVAADGHPFLLLRDLCEEARGWLQAWSDREESISVVLGPDAPALRLDVSEGQLHAAGLDASAPATGPALARAVFEAALEMEKVFHDRLPSLRDNPYLADLAENARSLLSWVEELELAERPDRPGPERRQLRPSRARRPNGSAQRKLIEGELRRISLLGSFRRELPDVRWLRPADDDQAWIRHGGGWCRISMTDGALLAEFGDEAGDLAIGEPGQPILHRSDGKLRLVAPGGELLWERDTGLLEMGERNEYAEHLWVLADGASLVAFDVADGSESFRLDPPAAVRSQWARDGWVMGLAADNGLLYSIDLSRREIVWRMSLRLRSVAVGGGWIAGIHDGPKGLELVGVRATERSVRFRCRLPLHEAERVVAHRGGFLVTGVGATGGELLRVDRNGELLPSLRPILGPTAPEVLVHGAKIFLRGSEGACSIERGKVRWSAPVGAGGAPIALRGLLALPGEHLHFLDQESGRPLLATGPTHGADHLLASSCGNRLLMADHHGTCLGLRIGGALGVV